MDILDRQTVDALMVLDTAQFRPFVALLEKIRDAARDTMETNTVEAVWRRMQGRAELAKDLLAFIRQARDLLAKMD